ncbi:YchJ family protein [Paludibacterium yongneupense]|uniref:YchJ family protein n=1 Tax=Paludibacterium yongneupense TaxID=400061 RepID=UPI0003F860C3|nr:YchJ family metal-binding protein [Paludibacterium yongneupense]
MKKAALACPCGLGPSYEQCCGRYLASGVPAPTAEALMRSRYTAYTRADEAYLLASWHASTRPTALGLAEEGAAVKWLELTVLSREAGGENDSAGTVRFVARYKAGGRACRLSETSRFVREGGRWYYLDGDVDG